jgi:lysophospholipase L1-like esterase
LRALFIILLSFGIQSCRKDDPEKDLVVMLGDSMTRRGNWSRLLRDNIVNLGVDGIKSTEVLGNTLSKAVARKPDFVYLMIGFNNANTQAFNLEDYKADLTAICDTLRLNKIPFAIQSVLPPTIAAAQSIGSPVTKENTDLINAFLIKLCAERTIPFIELRTVLTTKYGHLNENYSTDGIHLNEQGYRLWADFLR